MASREASGTRSRGFTVSLEPLPVRVSGSGPCAIFGSDAPRDLQSHDAGHGTHCRGIPGPLAGNGHDGEEITTVTMA